MRTYKYRLYPDKEQARMLDRYFEYVHFVYNHFLTERKKQSSAKSESHIF
ncbi:MAG: helix-turn-helix domain-containing protein [Bacteroides heparinolyticus]|nr:helix-turn-helix domain-containing protein [Bacteroides heparinolyticus]